ncbi:protein of unknown function (plasmid) [Cupriavidus neocaledonicus]|uniref:Uncharacterized protein n=1 Tax=Cupriavidus neocaledonicus TaxID=1040979 RepID=A0A375HWT0_9BURK|nr:protein of unknown function [Cupriavidus neocaledonicus]SPD62599.1 protein of unknown function [Cupriavidus neocaledonicus]
MTEAIGYIQRDDDFKLIGRAAERWQRTMVGDWSIGRRRGEWQRQPPLDETLRERLRQLLDAPAPERKAQEQLEILTKPLDGDQSFPQVRE